MLVCGCVMIAKWDSTQLGAAPEQSLLRKGKIVLIASRVAIHDVLSFASVTVGSNCIDVSCYCEE